MELKSNSGKHLLITLVIALATFDSTIAQNIIKHFIFFGLEREGIHDTSFLNNEHITGAQLKYMWRELEPEENEYNLELIQNDLDFLTSKGKKLFIQLQDVTFDTSLARPVPDYISKDKRYHGGVNIQYETKENDAVVRAEGYVARRWDTNVEERFGKLLTLFGERFDGKIEGINLPETSVGFGETGKLYPNGFTPETYRNAIMRYMSVAKKAFSRSEVILYANFMPGEWLPWDDKSYLRSLYVFARDNSIGMGGPDIKIGNKAHMNHIFRFIKENTDSITTGVAVQDGNYEEINPETGKRVTIREICDFGKDYLGLDYIFWCTQEPFYTKELLPFLKNM